MKAYIYYSKNKISKINDEYRLRNHMASIITNDFFLFDDMKPEDVLINRVKISNDIDVLFILDTIVSDNPQEMAKMNNKIKEDLLEVLRQDQGTESDYIIRTKYDPNHKGLSSVSDKREETVSKMNHTQTSAEDLELDYEKRAKVYVPVEPAYSFDRVILPEDTIEKIEEALNILKYENKVFQEWGLYEIQPHPSSSLSFFGPSGTGKTMAAEAVAQKLGKKILKVSYADVESKYHGEGPKMVKAIFLAAERENAVLFFDEADSLLSKRLTNVSQGSEQAINSMRSQLLICLEEFRGIVIFATNLVINYDQAFLTRLISVEFAKPDVETRKKIWDVHIRPADDGKEHMLNIPLAENVDTQKLAEEYDFAGREIRNAVISACISAAMSGSDIVSQEDFIKSCQKIYDEKQSVANAKDHTINDKNKEILKNAIVNKIKEGEMTHVSTPTE